MRRIFMVLMAACALALAAADRAKAGTPDPCTTDACRFLNKGHVRGRIPVTCVPIPYVKEGYGEVAMFVLADFDPEAAKASSEGLQRQLEHALFRDSKITGPSDNFCRGAHVFRGARYVVLCDEHHWGSVTGASLAYAIRYKRASWHVRIGTHVR